MVSKALNARAMTAAWRHLLRPHADMCYELHTWLAVTKSLSTYAMAAAWVRLLPAHLLILNTSLCVLPSLAMLFLSHSLPTCLSALQAVSETRLHALEAGVQRVRPQHGLVLLLFSTLT